MAKGEPPGGHGVAIVIGVPKEGGKGAPPGMDREQPREGGKASREEAGVVPPDQHCIDCQNYDPQTGDCSKVEGSFEPDAACLKYFTPVADEDNEQAEGEPPEGGADEAMERR